MNISRNCLEANSFISGGYGASGQGQKELFIEVDRNVPDVTGTAATFLNSNYHRSAFFIPAISGISVRIMNMSTGCTST